MSAISEQPTNASMVSVASAQRDPFFLYVGRVSGVTVDLTGTVCSITAGGASVVFKGIRVGSFLPVKITKLLATLGADATNVRNTLAAY